MNIIVTLYDILIGVSFRFFSSTTAVTKFPGDQGKPSSGGVKNKGGGKLYIYPFIVSYSHKRFATGYTNSSIKIHRKICTQIYNRIQ